jgi:methylmalonyl-CoA mutase
MIEEKLFQEFRPISTEEWKEKIIKDLKGADYDRKLVWHTDNGFDLQPFYRSEDLEELSYLNTLPGDFPFTRGNKQKSNHWKVNQLIEVEDITSANKKALEIRMNGVDSLAFVFKSGFKPGENDIENLLENIRVDVIDVNFRTDFPGEMIGILENLAKKHNRELNKIKGSVFCDPLSEYSIGQKKEFDSDSEFLDVANNFRKAKNLGNFHCLTVDGSIFHNSGASTVSEIAFTLSTAVEYLNKLSDSDLDIDEISRHIRFNLATGSSYFVEIAKLRAIRFLWAKIMNEYGINYGRSAKMYIHSVSSSINKTIYDPYVNMLRTTTETMSAALGGSDSITVLPFDFTMEKTSELGQRIARNQQLLLKGESHFDKVNDPAAGSYYIETITDKLIKGAWDIFLQTEEKGGYLKAFDSGFVSEKIKSESAKLMNDIAFKKKVVLGTNQYPNINEAFTDFSIPGLDSADGKFLKPFRYAAEFERLRNKTDFYSKNSERPKVWMFTYGNIAMLKARSQFAGNFFGCAGFEIIDNTAFKTIDEGIEAAKEDNPDIVVICSSDEEYSEIALPVFEALKNDFTVVLAGYPKALVEDLKSKGFSNFIHTKSNILEDLKRYQRELGMVEA